MSAILHQTRLLVAKQEKLLANKFGYQCLSYFSPHFCNTLLKTQSPWAHNSIQAANSRNLQFYVPDPKHGYVKDDRTFKEKYVESLKLLKTEVNMWKDEMAEQIKNDPMLVLPPGETDCIWSFGDNDEDINKFIASADSDYNEGHSHCKFEKSPAGYGLFHGNVSSELPGDAGEHLKRAGWCNISSIRKMKSFQRNAYYEWSIYNTLVLRVRGDGRPYMINLKTDGYFDVMWMDLYSYVLYTRGGPHWQTTRIPFSKFMLSVRGRVQDKQCPIPRNKVSSLGITAASGNLMDGDFRLEIDYIGLEYDPVLEETFAYEQYKMENPFIVGS